MKGKLGACLAVALKPNKTTGLGSDHNVEDEGMVNSQNQEAPGPANKNAVGATRGRGSMPREGRQLDSPEGSDIRGRNISWDGLPAG
jgi:hypothetical protein